LNYVATEMFDHAWVAQNYAQHAILSHDPDRCGQLLYEAAIQACNDAETDYDAQNWTRWGPHLEKAQQVAAVVHDLFPNTSEAFRLIRDEHRMIWTLLTRALLQRDISALRRARQEFEECLRQITQRLDARTDPVETNW